MIPSFDYIRPDSVREAVRELSSEGSRVQAGGTDLLGCLRDRVFGMRKMVSINGLPNLKGISEEADGLRIGALSTITETAAHPVIREKYRGLAEAASAVASPQLRNQGTIGGNICQKPRCWYYRGEFHCLRKGGGTCFAASGQNQYHCILGGRRCFIVHPSDTAPALIAFNAKVHITGPDGKRTVPLGKFHVLPEEDVHRETILDSSEIVTDIFIPSPPAGLRSSYRKVRARRSWDFAVASVALALQFKGGRVERARIVLGGAAPVPWRSKEAEEVVAGNILNEKTAADAASAAIKNARPLEHNRYKVNLFRGLIEEELLRIA